MNTLFQLISHEYRKYVFTRGFLLFLAIIPLSAFFGFFAREITERASPVRPFVVIDETGQYGDIIEGALRQNRIADEIAAWDAYVFVAIRPSADGQLPLEPPFLPAPVTAERIETFAAAGGLDAALREAKPYLREGAPDIPAPKGRFVLVDLPDDVADARTSAVAIDLLKPYFDKSESIGGTDRPLFAAVVIPENLARGGAVQFWTQNLVDTDLRSFVDRTLTSALKAEAYAGQGVPGTIVAQIEEIAVDVSSYVADEEGGEVGAADMARTFVPLALAYALFVMITTIGSMLLTSTVEEKSNKIVEVLLSSISATQLMVGKLIGLALVGITVPALFLIAGFVAIQVSGEGEFVGALAKTLFASPLVPLFFCYFVLGYLLLASIYLAVGAMSNSIQDAQSFVGPLTITMLLPLPFLQMIVQDPNGLIARIFTWIPLYTPYAVMMRITANPPVWEIAGATALLLLVVGVVVMTMGRVYKNGVLSSGGAPTLRQVRDLARRRNA